MAFAAGILPYTFHDGQLYVFLGKDIRDNHWSDFGGKCEACDDGKPLNTAIREFYEETCGIVLDLKALHNRMLGKGSNSPPVHSCTQNGKTYYMYTLEIPYNATLRSTYRKLLVYLKYIRVFRVRIEKTDLKWVHINNLLEDKVPLRPVFRASFNKWWESTGSHLVKTAKILSALNENGEQRSTLQLRG